MVTKYYFRIQVLRVIRWMNSIGLHPILGMTLSLIFFVVGSLLVYSKTDYGAYLYLFSGITCLTLLGKKSRIDELKRIFDKPTFLKVRWIENYLLIFPFIIFMLVNASWLVCGLLLMIATMMSWYSVRVRFYRVIRTPFRSRPFEHIIGFRQMFVWIILLHVIGFKSFQVENYNLGIFVLGVMFLFSISFYTKSEYIKYVIVYNKDFHGFLKHKMFFGIINHFLMSVGIWLPLFFLYPDHFWITVSISVLSIFYFVLILLMKYSIFPRMMNLPEGIWLLVSLWFPPILLVLIPWMYLRAKKNIEPLLI